MLNEAVRAMSAALAISAAAFAAAAQSTEENAAAETEATLTAEEVLANPLDDSDYEQTTRCLSTVRYRRVEIVNGQALAFHGRGDDVWLNLLHRRCPGLRKGMMLSIEQTSFRVCAGDRITGASRHAIESVGAVCTLGRFLHVSKQQFEAMRDALLAGERNLTVDRTLRSTGPTTEAGTPPNPKRSANE